jgi:hypothetical protein
MGCERRNVGCFQLDRSVDDYSAAVKFRETKVKFGTYMATMGGGVAISILMR